MSYPVCLCVGRLEHIVAVLEAEIALLSTLPKSSKYVTISAGPLKATTSFTVVSWSFSLETYFGGAQPVHPTDTRSIDCAVRGEHMYVL